MTSKRKNVIRKKESSISANKQVLDEVNEAPPSVLLPIGIIKEKEAIVTIMLLAAITRFYNIHEPRHVCWDETHFGKMASWYINRTFFFDVHPPLGKMLIALSGSLTGYNGSFAYSKPGDLYTDYSQYLGMRIFCATLGLMTIPFTYYATKSMTRSISTGAISAFLLVFDNGMITLNRYILLDPPLLFFISGSILGLAKFSFDSRINERHFTLEWFFWLFWTGTFLACAISVKFVGLFIILWVGFRTIYELWIILGDVQKPLWYFYEHLLIRTLALIIWPLLCYMLIFWLHLNQLNRSGNGDGFYSSAFQSQLIGNSLHNASWPVHLAYGATVTIKNNRIGGAYLHSHWHLYPEGLGARQQQVTAYSHKDSNNKWIIKKALDQQTSTSEAQVEFVRNGDLIRLEHLITHRNLHSHKEVAPITKRHYQVTCYGEMGIGDANDIWRIEIDDHSLLSTCKTTINSSSLLNDNVENLIFTVKTRFRLIHVLTNCALHSHSKQLPKWAYEQLEVTCNPRLFDKNNLWNIEDNIYPLLPNVSFEEYAPSFFERFFESHSVMFQGNAGLKPKEGELTSRPWQWPINYRGQFFSASNGQKIYLLGNSAIWWSNLLAIPFSLIILIKLIIQDKRNEFKRTKDNEKSTQAICRITCPDRYKEVSFWLLLGWSLHYLPFYFMSRVLYFHHYFPAFIFSCMLTAATYEYLINQIIRKFQHFNIITRRRLLELSLIIAIIIIYIFILFLPITYGTKQEADEGEDKQSSWKDELALSSLKWLDSWEF